MNINKEIMKKATHPTIIWSLICAIAIISLLTVFIQVRQSQQAAQNARNRQIASEQSSEEASEEAIVALDFGNGKVRRFKGPTENNAKAWDLFQQAIAVGSINVEVSDHFVPRVIDGIKDGDNGKYWSLYVNNVKQKFAPFEIYVKPGDEVVFRFE